MVCKLSQKINLFFEKKKTKINAFLNVMWDPRLDPETEKDIHGKIDETQIKSVV